MYIEKTYDTMKRMNELIASDPLYTFYTLGINSIFGCRLHGYGIIIFRVDILWHSRGCFDGHPLDLLHLFLDIGLLELLILTINKNIDN